MYNRLYTEFVMKFFHDFFFDIPWQKTGKRVGMTGPVSLPEKVIRKISRLPYRLGFLESKKEYTNYPTWIRDSCVQAKIKNILNNKNSYASELLEVDPVKQYLIPHLKKKADYSREILRVVTMEIYLRKVFENNI